MGAERGGLRRSGNHPPKPGLTSFHATSGRFFIHPAAAPGLESPPGFEPGSPAYQAGILAYWNYEDMCYLCLDGGRSRMRSCSLRRSWSCIMSSALASALAAADSSAHKPNPTTNPTKNEIAYQAMTIGLTVGGGGRTRTDAPAFAGDPLSKRAQYQLCLRLQKSLREAGSNRRSPRMRPGGDSVSPISRDRALIARDAHLSHGHAAPSGAIRAPTRIRRTADPLLIRQTR